MAWAASPIRIARPRVHVGNGSKSCNSYTLTSVAALYILVWYIQEVEIANLRILPRDSWKSWKISTILAGSPSACHDSVVGFIESSVRTMQERLNIVWLRIGYAVTIRGAPSVACIREERFWQVLGSHQREGDVTKCFYSIISGNSNAITSESRLLCSIFITVKNDIAEPGMHPVGN